MQASTFQMAILLQYNTEDIYTVQQLTDSTQIKIVSEQKRTWYSKPKTKSRYQSDFFLFGALTSFFPILGHIGAGFANIIEIQVAGKQFLDLIQKAIRCLQSQHEITIYPFNLFNLNCHILINFHWTFWWKTCIFFFFSSKASFHMCKMGCECYFMLTSTQANIYGSIFADVFSCNNHCVCTGFRGRERKRWWSGIQTRHPHKTLPGL